MRTREERIADRQARRQERRDSRNELIDGVVSAAFGNTPTPTPTPITTPTPVVEDAPVVDPVQDELSRQAREVASGNVNSAQADYFKQQNPNLPYNKIEKMTRVNPVSNREDKMTKLFGGLYGSEESRGIL